MDRESNYFNVMGKFAFAYLFPIFSENMKKIYRSKVQIFLQNAPSNSVLFVRSIKIERERL